MIAFDTFSLIHAFPILSFMENAEDILARWRSKSIRIGTSDLRIAAICVDHKATLITRNRRDFGRVPDLDVEFWD